MAGCPHEELDTKDLEVRSSLEHSIVALKNMGTCVLIMKENEEILIGIEHGEHKALPKGSERRDAWKLW
jgi:hypothetical protein